MKKKSPQRRQGRPPAKRYKLEIDDRRIFVIRAGKTKHGPRSGGKRWWAQLAMTEVFKESGLPRYVANWEELTRRCNDVLKRDPNYIYEELDSMTVRRAFQELQKASNLV